MEIEINLSRINHENYIKIINYLKNEKQKIKQKAGGFEKIYHFYVKGEGNPPKYDLNIKINCPLKKFPEDVEKFKKSVRGLISLLEI